MGKRYYVEVSEVTDDGRTVVRSGMVDDGALIVIGDEGSKPELTRAIAKAMSHSWTDIVSKQSTRNVVAARTAYIHYSMEMGDTANVLAKELGLTRRHVQWYADMWEDKLSFDKLFAAQVRVISEELDRRARERDELGGQPASTSNRRRGRGKKPMPEAGRRWRQEVIAFDFEEN